MATSKKPYQQKPAERPAPVGKRESASRQMASMMRAAKSAKGKK